MNRNSTPKKDDFIGYEYKEVTIKKNYVSLYTDSYENFGWIYERIKSSVQNVGSVILVFKRDRKIRNKAELTRLQRQFDSIVEQIDYLERMRTIKASVVAYVLGVLGCAFMAGSVFAFVYAESIPVMILLAIPGFLGWILSYPVYVRLANRKSAALAPQIEEKYDEAYDVTKRANSLLGEMKHAEQDVDVR